MNLYTCILLFLAIIYGVRAVREYIPRKKLQYWVMTLILIGIIFLPGGGSFYADFIIALIIFSSLFNAMNLILDKKERKKLD